ncbi:MAG: ABC transporter permease [Ignavibacteriales bacterium]|nr:ABC transporter permease [Ignavibacteriales bacterium]MBK7980798.1 ABC transporter permease [Ignavibacteriota bacterium]
MERKDLLRISLDGLNSNKLRTFLTMLGVIFGVASVIAMVSIGEGARQETLEQIELLGSNNIIIKKNSISEDDNKKAFFSPGLTLKDSYAISKIISFIKSITPQKENTEKVTYKSKVIETKIVGTSENYYLTFNSKLSQGNFFDKYHIDNYENVCVLGSGINNKIFNYENPLGKKIKIGSSWFKVIGVISSKKEGGGTSDEIRNFNEDIYIPITTMFYKMKVNKDDNAGQRNSGNNVANAADRVSVDQLTVKVYNDTQIFETATLIKRILLRKHYGVEDFKIIIPEAIMEQKQKTQSIFNVVMGAIAGISLLVGGIGIMNIMLANIMERTKEIGIRRAVGATQSNILYQFMYEALIISLLGGIIGTIIGFILTSIITKYAGWRTLITPYSVIIAFLVSMAVGVGFGLYPAKKAAEKDPIESLRYE